MAGVPRDALRVHSPFWPWKSRKSSDAFSSQASDAAGRHFPSSQRASPGGAGLPASAAPVPGALDSTVLEPNSVDQLFKQAQEHKLAAVLTSLEIGVYCLVLAFLSVTDLALTHSHFVSPIRLDSKC